MRISCFCYGIFLGLRSQETKLKNGLSMTFYLIQYVLLMHIQSTAAYYIFKVSERRRDKQKDKSL